MNELTTKLELFAQARGIEKLDISTRKHIKRKIDAEFGSSLEIFPDNKGKLLVIPEDLSLKEMAKAYVTTKSLNH